MKATTTTWSRHGSRASRTRAAAVAAIPAWTPCDPGLECAKVPVPMDWMNPSGEKIQLAVIRHKASKPDQRIGSIFFNPGGPGDTGVGAVKGAADDLDAWGNGRFDIVSWDPRGTYGNLPDPLLHRRRVRGGLLEGREGAIHTGGLRRLPAAGARPGQAVRRGDGTAAVARLDGRHRPGHRRPAGRPRRGQDHLRRPLVRDGPRPDLPQHVPAARARHDARLRRRRRAVYEEQRGPAAGPELHRRGLRPVREAVRRGRADHVQARWPPGADHGAARGPAPREAPQRHHPRAPCATRPASTSTTATPSTPSAR